MYLLKNPVHHRLGSLLAGHWRLSINWVYIYEMIMLPVRDSHVLGNSLLLLECVIFWFSITVKHHLLEAICLKELKVGIELLFVVFHLTLELFNQLSWHLVNLIEFKDLFTAWVDYYLHLTHSLSMDRSFKSEAHYLLLLISNVVMRLSQIVSKFLVLTFDLATKTVKT